MNVYVNELSFHGQFPTIASLMGGLKGLWTMRELCRRYGSNLYCSRIALFERPGALNLSVRNAVLQHATPKEKSMLLTWLDKTGPFWDEARLHDAEGIYLFRQGQEEELATDTGIAECIAHCLAGNEGATASVTPSDFEYTPILTEYEPHRGGRISCVIDNHWQWPSMDVALSRAVRFDAWGDLARYAQGMFVNLHFSPNAFGPITRHPFSRQIADRIIELLRILDGLSGAVQQDGSLNAVGQAIRTTYLIGHQPLFTDSSDDEKIAFKQDLTFDHPLTGESVMFPWHGKVRNAVNYRIHFEWPKVDPARPLPVVYVGPKLTKR